MKKKTLVIISLVLLVILAALTGGGLWLKNNHVFVNMRPYPKNAQELDLRGKKISLNDYMELSHLLPECDIVWDVPFQGGSHSSDSQELIIGDLTADDIARLALFEDLQTIDAYGCRDYAALLEAKKAYPQVDFSYNVTIGGVPYGEDTTEVTLTQVRREDMTLLELLPEPAV